MKTRKELMDYYGSIMERIEQWERSENNRLREEILVPIFGGNGCVLHNSMIAWEQGKPWKEMVERHGNYYAKGRHYHYKQEQIWSAKKRLSEHFWQKWIDASRLPA